VKNYTSDVYLLHIDERIVVVKVTITDEHGHVRRSALGALPVDEDPAAAVLGAEAQALEAALHRFLADYEEPVQQEQQATTAAAPRPSAPKPAAPRAGTLRRVKPQGNGNLPADAPDGTVVWLDDGVKVKCPVHGCAWGTTWSNGAQVKCKQRDKAGNFCDFTVDVE